MDKSNTHFRDKSQRESELFKQLFLFRTELEGFDYDEFQYQSKVRVLIYEIDELLGILIDESDLFDLE